MIEHALKDANIAPHEVHYVEAHGTATALGDPVEASALASVYGRGRKEGDPLFVGSLKANLGHMEAAGGLAGLIKAVLVLNHEKIPPNAQLGELNTYISDAVGQVPIAFPAKNQITSLPGRGDSISAPLSAGVSAFGACGTIAHIILQQAPEDNSAAILRAENPVNYQRTLYPIKLIQESAKGVEQRQQKTNPTTVALNYALPAISLTEMVRQCAAEVLESGEAFENDDKLQEDLGMDSLAAIELRNQLIEGLENMGAENVQDLLPASSLFSRCPTVLALAEYLRGAVNFIQTPESVPSVSEMVRNCVAEVLAGQGESFENDDVLQDLGMDSLAAIELRNQLIEGLENMGATNVQDLLPASSLFSRCPTVDALVQYLDQTATFGKAQNVQNQAPVQSMAVCKAKSNVCAPSKVENIAVLNNMSSNTHVCFVHGIDGDVAPLTELAKRLPYRVYGISLTASLRKSCHSLNDLASAYVDNFQKAVDEHGRNEDTRLVVMGYSFGVVIAFEMAMVLEARREKIDNLLLCDMQAEWPYIAWGDTWRGGVHEAHELACRKFSGDAWDEEAYRKVCQRDAQIDEFKANAMFHYMPASMRKKDWSQLLGDWTDTIDYLVGITGDHRPSMQFTGTCHMIRSSSPEFENCVLNNRNNCSKDLGFCRVPGNHFTMMEEEYLNETVQAIQNCCEGRVSAVSNYDDGEVSFSKQEQEKPQFELAAKDSPTVAFLFTGQGSQYIHMAQQLYAECDVFNASLKKCDAILQSTPEWNHGSILSIIYPTSDDSTTINMTRFSQPAIFSIEYSLFELWKSKGVVPNVMMGHSVGEYVAACVAGVFSLEDGLRLIAARGAFTNDLDPMNGVMVAIRAGYDAVEVALQQVLEESPGAAEKIAVAAVNGPKSVVMSGSKSVVDQLLSKLPTGIGHQPLAVSHAFHSPLLKGMLGQYRILLEQTQFNRPKIPIVSTLRARLVDDELLSIDYWLEHVTGPVMFEDSIKQLLELNCSVFLECGAHPTLARMGLQCAAGVVGTKTAKSKFLWLHSLDKKDKDSMGTMSVTLQKLVDFNVVLEEPSEGHIGNDAVYPPPGSSLYFEDPWEKSLDSPVLDMGLLSSPEGHEQDTLARVRKVVCKICDESDIADGDNLADVGLDSLAAIELLNELIQEFGFEIDAGMIFGDHASIRLIAESVARNEGNQEEPVSTHSTASISHESSSSSSSVDDDEGNHTSEKFQELELRIERLENGILDKLSGMQKQMQDSQAKANAVQTQSQHQFGFHPHYPPQYPGFHHPRGLTGAGFPPNVPVHYMAPQYPGFAYSNVNGGQNGMPMPSLYGKNDFMHMQNAVPKSMPNAAASNSQFNLGVLSEGKGFVVLLTAADGGQGPSAKDALFHFLKSNKEMLEEKIRTTGALLLRNVGLETAEDFSNVCKIFTSTGSFRDYRDGISPRTKVAEGVFTSTEYPAHLDMALHNEMSYNPQPPAKIAFFCEVNIRMPKGVFLH
jgi:malonyl CoA-acyl carrier protein transacylase/acyl carrier protein/thioesterase domain-containing protein